jgi:hypothetical protein
MLITPLIVCGGSGTRLWPASRANRPKQFLPLFGPRSSFGETLLRVADPELFGRPVVIANREHRSLVVDQVREIGVEIDLVLEPKRAIPVRRSPRAQPISPRATGTMPPSCPLPPITSSAMSTRSARIAGAPWKRPAPAPS